MSNYLRLILCASVIIIHTLIQQVMFTGFSYGSLSELPESDYFSCSMGQTIAEEIGVYGYRPSVLMDMLAGKRAEVGNTIGAYMRTFSADCSPSDLETALQVCTPYTCSIASFIWASDFIISQVILFFNFYAASTL